MKYITTETAADITRAMTMAAVHTWHEFIDHINPDQINYVREIVAKSFKMWTRFEGIEVIETNEPEYPELHVFFDDTEAEDYDPSQWDDDCDYEVGYDPYLGTYTDDV